jgi:hypothetical protein
MESTISMNNMTSIPRSIIRKLGMCPGWKLDWSISPNPDEIIVRVIPSRSERARRLQGRGAQYAPDRSAVQELVAERESDG